jgi:hypothetical protein
MQSEEEDKGYQAWIDFFVSEVSDADDEAMEDADQPMTYYVTSNKS